MVMAMAGAASAQDEDPSGPGGEGETDAEVTEESEEDKEKAKEPGRGDFDAGGQVRLPSGPDEMGEYGAFNWIALDLQGRYFVLDNITINGSFPLAVKKPDGYNAEVVGGGIFDLIVKMPWGPYKFRDYEADLYVQLGAGYLRERAILLSPKDIPLYVGDFQPAFRGATPMRMKLSSALDFNIAPAILYQSGEVESVTALALPTSLVVGLGDLIKLGAELGMYTGDDFSFRPSNDGRLALGASLDVKLGKIIVHLGAGAASLLTSDESFYPTIKDSVYFDLNVKYAK